MGAPPGLSESRAEKLLADARLVEGFRTYVATASAWRQRSSQYTTDRHHEPVFVSFRRREWIPAPPRSLFGLSK